MKKLRLGLILIHPPSPTFALLFTLFWSPFAPLCPILRSPVKTSWINANLSLYHGSSMSIKNFFGKIQNILSLVVVNDPQMLKSRNNIFFSYTRHLTDITIERKRKKNENWLKPCVMYGTVKPQLSPLVGTGLNSPDNWDYKY